jgi:(4-O-methyl)-D-glucuronate---lignin esterase
MYKKYNTLRRSLQSTFVFFILSTNVMAQNYDESKVAPYKLPELLKTSRDQVVKDKSTWENIRRHEVLGLFKNEIYGLMPNTYDSLSFIFTNINADAMKGKATLKEARITMWKIGKPLHMNLIYFIPNKKNGPVPVFLLINNRGKNNTDPARNEISEFWPAEMVIDSGFAVAAFHVNDLAQDNKDTYQNGVLQLYPDQMKVPNGMKAIGAWAWGACRMIDYFEQEPDVDAKRIFVVGHSRGGKAALWAGANDKRFAMVFSNCSGNTGAALSKRKFGETVKAINTNFPHWFADNYKKYNDNEEALPVDQHMLIALIAPRPVYTTSATQDLWADPRGSYLSAIHAQPVYALYQRHSALTPEPPAANTPIINSYLGYHIREGKHDLTAYDWNNFIRFANYHLKDQKR